MFRFCRSRKRAAPADPAAQPGEGYRDALLSGWVSPPEVSAGVAAPAPAPAQAEPPDDAVLERFYRNQG
jgi:hypothetical protein